MKIVAVSDLHGFLPDVPRCDLLLLAGDLCPVTNHNIDFQANWVLGTFRTWLERQPAAKIVMVAGNHDFVFQYRRNWLGADFPAVYLEDSGVEHAGLHIWGSPWQPVFFDWAFNLTEPELARKWARIPENTDILVVHGPPRGYGDLTARQEHVGSPSLAERIAAIRLKLAVFGHIHPARGVYRMGETLLANVSLVDEKYEPVHGVWEWEF
jgi:Icc-related predicted phosphoesterase